MKNVVTFNQWLRESARIYIEGPARRGRQLPNECSNHDAAKRFLFLNAIENLDDSFEWNIGLIIITWADEWRTGTGGYRH